MRSEKERNSWKETLGETNNTNLKKVPRFPLGTQESTQSLLESKREARKTNKRKETHVRSFAGDPDVILGSLPTQRTRRLPEMGTLSRKNSINFIKQHAREVRRARSSKKKTKENSNTETLNSRRI